MLPYRERYASHGNPTLRGRNARCTPALGEAPSCWDPKIRTPRSGTHWDVGDQPVPPEPVPGVGSTGSVGVHQHQHVLLALRERRGEENATGTVCGTGSLHPRPASKEQPSRSFISPPNFFLFFFFPRFPTHAHFDGCAHAKCTEKARDERAPGEREGHKPARDELVLAV